MIATHLSRVNYSGESLEEISVSGIDLIYTTTSPREGYARLEWLDCWAIRYVDWTWNAQGRLQATVRLNFWSFMILYYKLGPDMICVELVLVSQ